jgi:hypothetical protein
VSQAGRYDRFFSYWWKAGWAPPFTCAEPSQATAESTNQLLLRPGGQAEPYTANQSTLKSSISNPAHFPATEVRTQGNSFSPFPFQSPSIGRKKARHVSSFRADRQHRGTVQCGPAWPWTVVPSPWEMIRLATRGRLVLIYRPLGWLQGDSRGGVLTDHDR